MKEFRVLFDEETIRVFLAQDSVIEINLHNETLAHGLTMNHLKESVKDMLDAVWPSVYRYDVTTAEDKDSKYRYEVVYKI